MTESLGILLCGHGSRDPAAIREFAELAEQLRQRLDRYVVTWGFLEFARPVLAEALDKLRAAGIRRVLAVPGMLFAAGHTKNDLPSVLNAYQAEHPEMEIRFGRDLAIDPKMMQAAAARIEDALQMVGDRVPRHQTLLMVVGRGTSDPDANANIAKVARLLWEGFGFGWAEAAYSGVTFPLVEPALEHATRLRYQRILIFPYFLFTGVLVQRIYRHAERVATRHPGIEFVKVPYLADHPLVLATILERIREIEEGTGNMNCQMCKYRVQMVGFEQEIGFVQASHHHHVEGIGVGTEAAAPHHHDHDHHHDAPDHGHHHDHHRHGHGRAPYPHADHPLGPRSLGPEGADD